MIINSDKVPTRLREFQTLESLISTYLFGKLTIERCKNKKGKRRLRSSSSGCQEASKLKWRFWGSERENRCKRERSFSAAVRRIGTSLNLSKTTMLRA
jgi:hypothetical protein